MAYSSDDNFGGLLDAQLLLEQEVAKSKKERKALPPSLFDPVAPPKSKLGLKFQLTKSGATSESRVVVGRKKVVVPETLGAQPTQKEVGVGKVAKKQIRKTVTEKTLKVAVRKPKSGVVEAPSSSVPSDHSGLSICILFAFERHVYTFKVANSISLDI